MLFRKSQNLRRVINNILKYFELLLLLLLFSHRIFKINQIIEQTCVEATPLSTMALPSWAEWKEL